MRTPNLSRLLRLLYAFLTLVLGTLLLGTATAAGGPVWPLKPSLTGRYLIDQNAAYTYYPTYAEVLRAYYAAPVLPVFMVEANYEFENLQGYLTTPAILRPKSTGPCSAARRGSSTGITIHGSSRRTGKRIWIGSARCTPVSKALFEAYAS